MIADNTPRNSSTPTTSHRLGDRGAFDTSRLCLYFMGWHMNPAPNSETAYYLRE